MKMKNRKMGADEQFCSLSQQFEVEQVKGRLYLYVGAKYEVRDRATLDRLADVTIRCLDELGDLEALEAQERRLRELDPES